MGMARLRLPAVFRRPAAWGILLALFALGGCNAALPWQKAQRLPCPDYRIPADAASLVKFRPGPGRDLTDVEYQGQIVNVRLACLHHIKDNGTGKVDVQVTPLLSVQPGPANKNKQIDLPYFIAVTDTKNNILFRQGLTQKVAFSATNARQVLNIDTSTLVIPLAKGQQGQDFVVYVGFELSHDQLDYNRKQIRDSRQ